MFSFPILLKTFPEKVVGMMQFLQNSISFINVRKNVCFEKKWASGATLGKMNQWSFNDKLELTFSNTKWWPIRRHP